MAVGRLPESGADLCSQPTISRLENLPGATALKRMMAAMVELFCDSFDQVPRRILLDIDDTEDRVHGGQQLSLWNAHYDSRCFLPIHIYEATSGKPVAVILRPGKTPDGAEVALVLRHVIGRIRARWPAVDIVVRGDSHYGRPEAMVWCERQRVGYIFGLAGNRVCCAGELSSFPAPTYAPTDRLTSGLGVSLVRVDGRFQRSGKGKELRTNPIEAEAIFEDIKRRFEASPDVAPSLGWRGISTRSGTCGGTRGASRRAPATSRSA